MWYFGNGFNGLSTNIQEMTHIKMTQCRYVCMYVLVCMYVFMYVCKYICINYVCKYVCTYLYVLCVYVRTYIQGVSGVIVNTQEVVLWTIPSK
jgi:hypothetical protein